MSLSVVLLPALISGVSIATADAEMFGQYYKMKTSMKDENILQEALENRGSHVTLDEMQIEASIGDVDIVFQREEDDTISAFFNKEINQHESKEFLSYTEKEYKRIVQQKTYEKLLERAKHEGLVLQSDKVNEENTIVLTFGVEE